MPLSVSERIAPAVALTFDDVLIVPGASNILPHQTDLRTQLSRNITLNIPLISAGMASVTEENLAIVLAQLGGIGVIHRDLSPSRQAEKVRKVKRFQARVIKNVISVFPETSLAEVMDLQARYGINGIPVLDEKTRNLIGMISPRDLKSAADVSVDVASVMTKENLVTARSDKNIDDIYALIKEKNIKQIVLVDKENRVVGMVTSADKEKFDKNPQACVDDNGCLRVAASVGVGEDHYDRVNALIDEGVDTIVVDDPHGQHKAATDMVTFIRRQRSGHVDVIAGNIATSEGAMALIDAGADAVKVGVGVGSTSNPRVIAGVGVPQLTALMDVVETCMIRQIPVIAGSGVRSPSDLAKSIAAGASSAMLGTLLMNCAEAPKSEKGEPLAKVVTDLLEGVRLAMSYTGCGNLKDFRTQPRFIRVRNQPNN